jgi:hypothetical protein
VVQNWLKILILLFFERVMVGSGVDNLIQVLIQVLIHQRGLKKYLINIRLTTFGANGVSVF